MSMQIFDVEPGREVTRYGSVSVHATGLLRHDAVAVAVTMLRVAPGGEIGRHPAPVEQLFVIVAGSGEVCGGDGVWQNVHTGQWVAWGAGEEHTTRAGTDGLAGLAIETP
jgi:quercetin dioxygenase-like cupin family protein